MLNGDGEVPRRYSVVEEGGSYGDCEIGRGDRRTRRSYDGLSCGKLVGRRMRGVRICLVGSVWSMRVCRVSRGRNC